jgi:ketosteroid isomerase-like protein
MAADQELTVLEDRRCAAMVAADAATLSNLFDDDLVWTHSSARTDTKAGFLDALKSGGTRYLDIKRSDEKVRVHGNLAVISGTADMQVILKGERRELRNRYTNVWAKRGGSWKMLAWQSTALS